MSWSFSQISQIFELAESGLLHCGQVREVARVSALRPDRTAWFLMGSRVCAYAGTLLLVSGVIFFFAYNWADLHRFAKIGLALAGVLAAVGAAAFSRPFSTGWRASLFGASLCTGALLALIGQIYQTGADIWELFAAWALLITPLVLLARSSASWFIWLMVANAALLFMLGQRFGYFTFSGSFRTTPDEQAYCILASFNLLLLIALELWGARLLVQARRHLHRLTALAMLSPLTLAAILCFIWESGDYAPLTVGFFGVAAVMLWFYNRIRHDLAMLAIAGFALIIVTTTALAHWLFEMDANFFTINLVALYLILTTGALAVWLKRLHRRASTLAQGEAA
jgi:uncharacterized membrane protein